MGRCSSFALIISILSAFTCYHTATSQDDGICDLIYCGEGSCKPTTSIPFFECDCFSGWIKIPIGPVTFPACLLPNCTLNLGCGNGATPPPPPPLLPFPPAPPPLNLTDPCNLVWCAEGSCLPNGTTGHICQCNEGSANLINNPELPCFQACFFGADCNDLELFPPPPPPPPNSGLNGSPPPPISSDSAGNGWKMMMDSRKILGALIFIWITLI